MSSSLVDWPTLRQLIHVNVQMNDGNSSVKLQ